MKALPAALLTALLLAGCTPASQAGRAPSGSESMQAASEGATTAANPTARPFALRQAGRFAEPWAMAFLPGSPRALITLRPGTLVLYDTATGEGVAVGGVPRVKAAGQGGLGDVALSPTFATDRLVYLSWAEAGPGDTAGAAVGRARLETSAGPTLSGLEVIWRQQPKVTGSGHFGHRLAFSPDGRYLFVTSGERQKFAPAQDLEVDLGKILRLLPDGSPAPGNPFANRGPVAAEIWSYGHRNPLGIAFDAAGNLWSSEMGPLGGDELNLIRPGGNYGWPQASNGSNYDGSPIPDHASGDGFDPPAVWWDPSISPGSLLIYSGGRFPAWRGDAFLGALSGQALARVQLRGTTATKADRWDLGARIRAVAEGPGGSIWLLEDGPDARLLELLPP